MSAQAERQERCTSHQFLRHVTRPVALPASAGRRGGRWRIKLSVVYDGPCLLVVNCCVRSKAILGQCTEHGWIILLITLPRIIFSYRASLVASEVNSA
jgi:hypothetical protein